MQFKYIFLIQCIIFYHKYNYVLGLYGINVRRANETEFPATVAIMVASGPLLQIEMELNQVCTGTLITKQDVITAINCLGTTFGVGFKVLIGSIDLYASIEYFPIYIFSYEHWAQAKNVAAFPDSDLTIVKIIGEAPENVPYLPLSYVEIIAYYALDAQVAGWGRLTNHTKTRYLHVGTVRLLTSEQCQRRYFNLKRQNVTITERHICSKADPPVVVNQGDNGGPLMYFGAIIGINTGVIPERSDGSIHSNQINYHIFFYDYLDYIEEVITIFQIHY